jgi:hypothetical protein
MQKLRIERNYKFQNIDISSTDVSGIEHEKSIKHIISTMIFLIWGEA